MPSVDVERLLVTSPLFDEEWYALAAGVSGSRTELVRHYLAAPVAERVTPQPLFDARWFADQWVAAGGDGAARGRDLFVEYLVQKPYGVRTSPLLTVGYVRRPVVREHPHGPIGHLLAATAVGQPPQDPWSATRGRRPFADLRAWMLAAARRWRARVDGTASTEPASGPDGDVLVVGGHEDWRLVARTLRALDRTLPHAAQLSVVVLDHAGSALDAVMVEAWAARVRWSVTVTRSPASGTDVPWSSAQGRRVFLAAGVQPLEGWWQPLLRAAAEPGVRAAAPVLLSEVGTVRSAGVVRQRDLVYDLLADHPVEDLSEALGQVDVGEVRRSVVALGGARVDGDPADPTAPVEGAVRVCPTSLVLVPDDVRDAHAPVPEPGVSLLREVDEKALWSAVGLEVVEAGRDPALPPRVSRPSVMVSEGVPRLRWALRIASTPGPWGDAWGDTHFADSLAGALRAAGQEVVVDRRGAFDRPTTYLDDVALVLRGREPMRRVQGAVNLCWVISHPDLLDADEARSYDRVLAASTTWAEQRSWQWGIEVESMLQATDPALFSPVPELVDTGEEVLFVGSSRGVDRPIVTDALAAGLPLAVHGPQWEDRLPPGVLKGTYVPNDQLGAAYGAAGVVLNDHWDDMRTHGFWSNRLFDAVATGARVVTDAVAGLTPGPGTGWGDVFGRSVQSYVTPDDLVRLCDPASYDRTFGDLAERLTVAERVRVEHSFQARAGRLLEVALGLGAHHA